MRARPSTTKGRCEVPIANYNLIQPDPVVYQEMLAPAIAGRIIVVKRIVLTLDFTLAPGLPTNVLIRAGTTPLLLTTYLNRLRTAEFLYPIQIDFDNLELAILEGVYVQTSDVGARQVGTIEYEEMFV